MNVTYHVNTFNRLHLLKNLLHSFEQCNVYEPFEWIVTDFGSTDGTREFLLDYSSANKWVTVLLSNETDYFDFLKLNDLHPRNKKQVIATIFGKAINIARSVAKGDTFMHIADDHQFFRKCDWISEMASVLDHRLNKTGVEDVSSILYRGLSYSRILKQNNETFPEDTSDSGIKYFVAKHKCYDDYHLMTAKMFDRIGSYFEIDKEKDEKILSEWRNGEYSRDHYTDYLVRTKEMNLRKIFMKFPCAIDFPNYAHKDLNVERSELIVPIIDNERIYSEFGNLNRPISTDEIFQMSNR